MNKFKSLTTTIMTLSLLSAASFSSNAMDKRTELALIDVCKSTLSNNIIKYKKATNSYNLRDKTVALKVMCNGDDIIDFAQKHGAYKTAARLERSISGNVSITDVAKVEKMNVNFTL
jgi:hypothetical protein